MGLPVNKIMTLEFMDSNPNPYFCFSEHIRQKYGFGFDQMKIFDLLTLEEMLAIRMEKMLRSFNGKTIFPVHELFKALIPKAMFRLINAYPSKAEQKKIQLLFAMSRKSRLRLSATLKMAMANSAYSLDK